MGRRCSALVLWRIATSLGSLALLGALVLVCASGATSQAPPHADAQASAGAPPKAPELMLPAAPVLDTLRPGRFDSGRMWTFEYFPTAYFSDTYGFAPDSSWLRSARLGALRIPRCTASFVSPHGLLLTNHHCAREAIEDVTRPGEDLLTDGFYAPSLEDERPIHDTWVDQLVEVRDVTDRVVAAVDEAGGGDAGRDKLTAVKRKIGEEVVGEFGGEKAGYRAEVVDLYSGGRYSVYVFRRYTDVRLVMAPEAKVANYGGDWDNFTYPRYDLDMTFYRVYGGDGKPLATTNYFPPDDRGATEGGAVFVVGNPGTTSRLQTVAQLEYRRDVSDRAYADLMRTRTPILQEYAQTHPERARQLKLPNTIWENLNALKGVSGFVAGLRDPHILARRRADERKLQAAIDADSALMSRYGDLISRMAALQDRKRRYAPEFAAFLAIGDPTLGSAALGRGLLASQYLRVGSLGASAEIVGGLREQLLAVADQPRELDEANLAERFRDIIREYGPDHPFVDQVLQGRSPEGAAAIIVGRSVLADSASTTAAVAGGTLTLDDPAVQLAVKVIDRYRPAILLQRAVSPEEAEVGTALGRAFFAAYGTAAPPDATFTLRISDGVVSGYEYNGTLAPAFTTFYGLYDRYYSHAAAEGWDLPAKWLDASGNLDLAIPFDFVSTADITGGSSGSPVLDRDLHLVGLAFDGNIESLSSDYLFLPERSRTVAVDVRAILQSLDRVYGDRRLVEELKTGSLAAEAEDDDEGRARTAHDAGLPDTVRSVLAHYARAVGGDALTQVRAETRRGTIVRGKSGRVPVEIVSMAPDQWHWAQSMAWGQRLAYGFDGREGWTQDGQGVGPMDPRQVLDFHLLFGIHAPLHLEQAFSRLTLKGPERVGGRDATVLIGRSAEGLTTELAFDDESGLLLRAGDALLEDYREVDGVTRPFRVRLGNMLAVQLSEIRHDFPVDETLFLRPESALPAGDPVIYRNQEEVDVPAAVMDECVGDYRLPSGPVLSVTREGRHLMLQTPGSVKFEIFAASPKSYFLRFNHLQFHFLTDDSGAIDRLALGADGSTVATRIR